MAYGFHHRLVAEDRGEDRPAQLTRHVQVGNRIRRLAHPQVGRRHHLAAGVVVQVVELDRLPFQALRLRRRLHGRIGQSHVAQRLVGHVRVWPHVFDEGNVARHGIDMVHEDFQRCLVAVLPPVVDISLRILEVDLALLGVPPGAAAFAAGLASDHVAVAIGRNAVPCMAEEVGQFLVVPRRAGIGSVLFPIELGQDVIHPLFLGLHRVLVETTRARHLLLAVVLRHAPVLQLADLAAVGIEHLARLFGRIVEGLGPLLRQSVASLFATQFLDQVDQLVLRLEEAEEVIAQRFPGLQHLGAEIILVALLGLLQAGHVAAAAVVDRQRVLHRLQRRGAAFLHGAVVVAARIEAQDLQLGALLLDLGFLDHVGGGLLRRLFDQLLRAFSQQVIGAGLLEAAGLDIERRLVDALEDIGHLGIAEHPPGGFLNAADAVVRARHHILPSRQPAATSSSVASWRI